MRHERFPSRSRWFEFPRDVHITITNGYGNVGVGMTELEMLKKQFVMMANRYSQATAAIEEKDRHIRYLENRVEFLLQDKELFRLALEQKTQEAKALSHRLTCKTPLRLVPKLDSSSALNS